jgi:hypothetical protein
MFSGKCSRCDVIKADFDEPPKPYDVLLCKFCYKQVCKDAARDNLIRALLEDHENLQKNLC